MSSKESYDPSFYSELIAVEDNHFWFRARNSIIGELIQQEVQHFPSGYHVLEIGCGTGNVLRILEEYCRSGSVIGMDLFSEGLRYARFRTKSDLVQGDILNPPFDQRFSLIGLFDVLEHIPDDSRVLLQVRNLLAPDGVFIVTVPAHPYLWSYFDEASNHQRRYTLAELGRKFRTAGYQIEYLTDYMVSTLPFILIRRKLVALLNVKNGIGDESSKVMSLSEFRVPAYINWLFYRLLRLELHWVRSRKSLPVGASSIVVARRAP